MQLFSGNRSKQRSGSILAGLLLASVWTLTMGVSVARAQVVPRHFANVPPDDEIEVLDPNADELGRPAVELTHGKHGLEVVVPHVVLVHKYYYTGDRSFQAQMLPGGPTIVVANHPKTGERCYIETNMMPGAPRVTYTGKDIIYDFGEHGMKIHFPLVGRPKVSYRSGQKITRQIGEVVHAEQWKAHAASLKEHAQVAVASTQTTAKAFVITTGDTVEQILLPVKHIVRLVPFATALTDPNRLTVRREKIAEHERQAEVELLQKQQQLTQGTYRTVR